jgi:hypothetical protein
VPEDQLDIATAEFDALVGLVAGAVATGDYLPPAEQAAYEQAENSIAEARRTAEQTAADLKLC